MHTSRAEFQRNTHDGSNDASSFKDVPLFLGVSLIEHFICEYTLSAKPNGSRPVKWTIIDFTLDNF